MQPIYDYDQVEMIASMYNGGLDKTVFKHLMNEVVKDELLEGATPQEAKKNVRTLVVSDFENTKNPQIKFHYLEADDPGPFKLLAPIYWKESNQLLGQPRETVDEIDPVEELELVVRGMKI